jgi:hypothetical protein
MDETDPVTKGRTDADKRKADGGLNEARRNAMRDLLYRKE